MSHVIMDGKLFASDRLGEQTTSVKGQQIDAWYSGRRTPTAATSKRSRRRTASRCGYPKSNQARSTTARSPHPSARRPVLGGLPTGTPTLADGGYDGAGIGVLPRSNSLPTAASSTWTPAPKRPAARAALPGRTRLRAAHRPLARTSPPHHQPTQDRRHRQSRACAHPLRTRPTHLKVAEITSMGRPRFHHIRQRPRTVRIPQPRARNSRMVRRSPERVDRHHDADRPLLHVRHRRYHWPTTHAAQSARCRVTPYLSNLLYMAGGRSTHSSARCLPRPARGDPTSRTRPAQTRYQADVAPGRRPSAGSGSLASSSVPSRTASGSGVAALADSVSTSRSTRGCAAWPVPWSQVRATSWTRRASGAPGWAARCLPETVRRRGAAGAAAAAAADGGDHDRATRGQSCCRTGGSASSRSHRTPTPSASSCPGPPSRLDERVVSLMEAERLALTPPFTDADVPGWSFTELTVSAATMEWDPQWRRLTGSRTRCWGLNAAPGRREVARCWSLGNVRAILR